ncbi:MAG: hypothetical protein RL701_4476 [Pseudomonadota bacterium]
MVCRVQGTQARLGGLLAAVLLFCVLQAELVVAQRTGENVVTAAKDAFGTSIGNERIGLYNASEVRGFSPLDAGNVRIEGFALDPQGALNSRLVAGSIVHVGLTAQGYPFPAPTGIVDYGLRKADDRLVLSILTGLGEYAGPFAEIDAKVPIVEKRLSIAAGLSYSFDEYYDGSDARVASFAVIPRWRPFEGAEITPFWSFTRSRDEEVAPYIITAGPYLPPEFRRRTYYGQHWADLDADVTNLGALAKVAFGQQWEAAAAIFHSLRAVSRDHAELFVDTRPDGVTHEQVIADPPQRRASSGGEASVTWAVTEGPRRHQLRARVYGRIRESAVSGSSAPFDLGTVQLGTPMPIAEPMFQFVARSHDRVRQWTAGLAYEGKWKGVGELICGLQKTYYGKVVDLPGLPRSSTESDPWLLNGTFALHATESLAFYAGYTRGLEESGIAPGNAANRNQPLPGILTQQIDAGLRYTLTANLRLVAGMFAVRKPNFTTDEINVFTQLGEVRHQGIELSIAGEVFERFTLVAGAVLMRPRVSGPAVDAGRIGKEPVGQTDRTVRVNINYRLPLLDGLSFDLGLLHSGKRIASSDNQISVPTLTTLDVGARYQFPFLGRPTTLRLQVLNISNAYSWRVIASNTFRTNSPRSLSATMAIDL